VSSADSPLNDKLIFAFGSRRSGTFWLQRIITAHPEVSDVPSESELFSLGIGPLFERFHHGVRSSPSVGQMWVPRDVLIDATRDFCDRLLGVHLDPGARYLSERTPAHAGAVSLIAEVYPDAHLIHIIRDGRDVARSLAARDWGPDSIRAAARMWKEAVLGARADAPPDRYLEVRYEDLLADPRAGALRLYEWLGLRVDDDVVDRVMAAATRAVNHDPKDPRLTTQKWRDHFSADDLADFNAEAGDLLAELGYPDAEPAPKEPDGGGLLGRLRRPKPPVAAKVDQFSAAQIVADQLLTHLHAGARDEIRALLADYASLRVVAGDDERQVPGADAVADALANDPTWRGRQIKGDQHPGQPSYTLVLAYELDGSTRAWRLLQFNVRDGLVQSLTLYELGAGPAAA
jgi:hypothetical protein